MNQLEELLGAATNVMLQARKVMENLNKFPGYPRFSPRTTTRYEVTELPTEDMPEGGKIGIRVSVTNFGLVIVANALGIEEGLGIKWSIMKLKVSWIHLVTGTTPLRHEIQFDAEEVLALLRAHREEVTPGRFVDDGGKWNEEPVTAEIEDARRQILDNKLAEILKVEARILAAEAN